MNYDIAVFDLDGTLTNSEKKITEKTKESLMKFMDLGGMVVLASGRPTYGVRPVAEELQLAERGGYILAFNGGQIISCRDDSYLHRCVMPEDAPAKLAEFSAAHNTVVLTYKDDTILTVDPDDIYVQKEAAINHMKVALVEDFAGEIDFPVTKCMLVGEGNWLATVEEKTKEKFGADYSITRSEPYFLEIMPNGIDKAQSLERFLNLIGSTKDRMAAFGDGFNDLSMIKYAGLGVAMGNAQQPVKDAADLIAPTNDEDGIAWVMENYIF
ncbi:MAG: Cof-type HAD-IIB family hydrolase [Eubacteriales bacterium]|nr:Cof-type HAD-IIB family hydrolase [Eubacteriales bacterium]